TKKTHGREATTLVKTISKPVTIAPRHSLKGFRNEAWRRANLSPRTETSATLRKPGSQVWRFLLEKFMRSVTADCLPNLCDATKGFSRGFACGRSNGRQHGCSQIRQKVSMCIHRAFQRAALRRIGCAACLSMSGRITRYAVMTMSNGT